MFPHRPALYHPARHHRQALLNEAEHARLVREARRAAGYVPLRVRLGDAVYGVALALSGLAGALGSERAQRSVTGGSEGSALRWVGRRPARVARGSGGAQRPPACRPLIRSPNTASKRSP